MSVLLSQSKDISAQRIIILASLIVFVLSLTQPAFYIDRKDYDAWSDSFFLFLLGWMGFLGGSAAAFIWLANPLYLLALAVARKSLRFSFYCSLAGSFLGACFLLLDSILTSESGSHSKITSLELGYWLWLTSLVLLTLSYLPIFLKRKN